jgi:metal-sulfur cluster biosynthetic enzyme
MNELLDLVCERLAGIVDPCSAATARPLSIVEMGLVKDVVVNGGEVTVRLRLTSPSCGMGWYFMQQADQRLADLPGVDRVSVTLDNGLEWTPDMMAAHVRMARAELFDRIRVASGRPNA